MRHLAFALAALVISRSAHADSKADVDKLVRAHLAATVGKQGALYDTLADGFWLEDASGSYFSLFVDCEMDRKSDACDSSTPLFGNSWFGTLKYSAIKPIVRIDDKIATFYVTGTLNGDIGTEGMDVKGKTQMRVSGIAKLGPKGWRIDSAKHSASLPDASLVKHGQVLVGNIFKPNGALETEVASWVSGHRLAERQSANAIGANGTAPTEVATTAAAMTKLAKKWDTLELEPLTFLTREEGNYAFVDVTVKWTAKKKTSLTFDVAFVLLKEADGWRWITVNFGAVLMTEYSFR